MIAPIETPQATLLAPAPGNPSADGTGVFRDLLARAQSAGKTDEVRDAAEQLVSTAFIAPVLRQIRESSEAAPPFQPTPAEKQFGSMLDAQTAQAIVQASDLPIVERLTETFRELASRTAGRATP